MNTKLLYTLAFLLLTFSKAGAVFSPLVVSTGYNADVIANGVGTGSATTSNDVDGANYIYFSNGWQQTSSSTAATTGLPATGLLTSAATSGLTFQLGNYSNNNDLRITTTGNGTLTFQTPTAATTFYLAAVSGSGSSICTVQINFSDGTNQSSSITVADWYGGTGVAYTGFQRMNRLTMLLDNAFNGPNIYQYSFPINSGNQTKLISSVLVTRTGGSSTAAVLNVFAASIDAPAPTCAAPTAPTATGITTTAATIGWTNSGTPLNYQIKYGAPGFPVATGGTSIFTTTKPYTINSLTVATSYDYYIRVICTAGDTSAWTPVANFATLCNAPATPTKKDSFNCGPGAVTLEASTTTTGASIKWYTALTGGTAIATGSPFTTASLAATTNYYVTAISGTCETSPRQLVVATIRPIPVVNIGKDTTICPGVSYTFNAGNPGGTYLWSTGETTQTITKNAVGQYSVMVTVNKCVNRDTILITPGVTPTPNLPATTNLCSGDVATLNAGNSGSTYVWTPGGATTQTINTTTGGTYNVNVKSVDGCVITSSTNLIVRPLPVDNLGNDTAICDGATITLDAGNTGYTYVWSNGATTQTIDATDSGTYVVTVTTPYNCVNVDDKHIAYLASPRTEGFNFIPMFFDELGKVSFSPLNPTNVDTYEWDFGDGSQHSTQMNPTHVYTSSGFFNVTLKVYNGCSDFSLSQEINVDLPTGIVTINKKDINLMIYPNPANTVINISNKSLDYKMEDITIFNSIGAIVYHQKANSAKEHQLSVEGFSNGTYFVRILTDKGFVNQQVQVLK